VDSAAPNGLHARIFARDAEYHPRRCILFSGLVFHALVVLPRPENRLAIGQGDAHAFPDRLRVFSRERENIGQEDFDALVHRAFVARLADDARRVEIICNRFAAEILLPEAAFSAARRGQATNEETAERIARSFHVSREVVFRRFLDHNLIDQAAYIEAVDRWNRQREPGGSGGDYYWTKLAYLGRDYVVLALRQYRQNRISQAQLAEYLDTKPKNLAGIEDYFAKGAA
jgi:IrrE N-terminal-like domain